MGKKMENIYAPHPKELPIWVSLLQNYQINPSKYDNE